MMSGRSAAWLARLNGVQKVGGSNPLAPTIFALSGNGLAGERRTQRVETAAEALAKVLATVGRKTALVQFHVLLLN